MGDSGRPGRDVQDTSGFIGMKLNGIDVAGEIYPTGGWNGAASPQAFMVKFNDESIADKGHVLTDDAGDEWLITGCHDTPDGWVYLLVSRTP